MKPLDIAIAGCGPAGLAAALVLSRDGHRITLFERFDVPRPLGSGLMIQPTGLAVLRALGLAEHVVRAGRRIDRLFGQTPSGRTVLDVRYAALGRVDHFGIGLHRGALFGILHEAVISEGIHIETGRTVARSELHAGSRRSLVFEGGSRAGPFDLVVDALGTATPLASATGRLLAYGALWASLKWPADAGFNEQALEQRYVRASVMAGILPIGTVTAAAAPQAAFFWSLRHDRLERWRQAGLAAWKDDVLSLWPAAAPLLDQIERTEQLTFARYSHRTLKVPAEPGLIHIGDAWHSTSPQLGQGANMALLDVFALGLALRAESDIGSALAHAVELRRRHVAIYQTMSSLFTPVYQSDSTVLPWVRDQIVGRLSKLWPAPPLLAAMVSGIVGDPLGRLTLQSGTAGDAANVAQHHLP